MERIERIKADKWYARHALLQAQLAEAEELVRVIPSETEPLEKELEEIKRVLKEVKDYRDAIEGELESLRTKGGGAKRDILRLTEELKLHAGQRPIESEE